MDTALTPTLPGFPTSATILPIDGQGRRPTLHAPGASLLMEIDDGAIAAASQARFIHWAAIGARRIDAAQRDRFLRAAKDAGAIITCDLIAAGAGCRRRARPDRPAAGLLSAQPGRGTVPHRPGRPRRLRGRLARDRHSRGGDQAGGGRHAGRLGRWGGPLPGVRGGGDGHDELRRRVLRRLCGCPVPWLFAARPHPICLGRRGAGGAGLGTLGKLQDFDHTLAASNAMRFRGQHDRDRVRTRQRA